MNKYIYLRTTLWVIRALGVRGFGSQVSCHRAFTFTHAFCWRFHKSSNWNFIGAFTGTRTGAFAKALTFPYVRLRRDVSPYVSLRLLTSRRKPLRFVTFAYVATLALTFPYVCLRRDVSPYVAFSQALLGSPRLSGLSFALLGLPRALHRLSWALLGLPRALLGSSGLLWALPGSPKALTFPYVRLRRDVSPYVSLRLLTSRRKRRLLLLAEQRFLTFAYVAT